MYELLCEPHGKQGQLHHLCCNWHGYAGGKGLNNTKRKTALELRVDDKHGLAEQGLAIKATKNPCETMMHDVWCYC